ncbi:hypothetical protein ACLB2K_033921 [Fragaria x ananassa]
MLLILKEGKLRLYNVCAGKIDNNIQLSVLTVKRFCGSSRGWLATVAKDPTDPTVDACEYYRLYKYDVIIQLWNPFDKATSPLCLPPLELGCGTSIRKVILLLDPLRDNNYIVAAITDSKLTLFRAGQKDWTRIQALGKCNDLILYKGRIYGAQNNGSLWSLDVNHSSTETRPKLVTTLNPRVYKRVHIVNSNTTGDLLLLQRSCKLQTPYPDEPYSFKIYKLVIDDDGSLVRQVEIKSIGDEAIFVGGGYQSVSVFASKFPGCQPNSINNTTDLGESPKTIGVCNLQDGTISKLDPFDGSKLMRLALWILPSRFSVSRLRVL